MPYTFDKKMTERARSIIFKFITFYSLSFDNDKRTLRLPCYNL